MLLRSCSPFLLFLLLSLTACSSDAPMTDAPSPEARALLDKYTTVRLTADLSDLTDDQRRLIALLIEAAREMDAIFWIEAYGDRDALMARIDDPGLRRFAEINYGPWDRLADNAPFIEGVGPKPPGANFYPADMTKEAFEAAAAENEALRSLYTMVRRDDAGRLVAIPYHTFFADRIERAAAKLEEAATLAEDPGFRHYLERRARALRTDDYYESDLAWMDMKDNRIDVVIGPIETYEDQLFGYKAAHETFVLLKDLAWSERLQRYATLLPALQRGLPVPEAYKREMPGTNSDLGAYDALYYAGDANAGSKTIAINLPNDERVQAARGSRRLQLKNAMQAKFDQILVPLAGLLIAEDQRPYVTFDAFFGNTMFHEVAHGLGIKNTLDGDRTVREALRDLASSIEEGKADVLGLYMVTELIAQGEWDGDLMEHYTTFLASIFRSIRFGGASAHGTANLIRFNFFQERGAFTRDEATGTYRVHPEAMAEAVDALSERILTLQGDGDYDAVAAFVDAYGFVGETLQADLDRVNAAGIPVDIVFEQGPAVLGLDQP
ncbi:Zn-dependent hydrolase [Rhodothermaceae bacterium RA]|nr:Zn-dependent hydrolase [Rhodothermaceae bacterium RA]